MEDLWIFHLHSQSTFKKKNMRDIILEEEFLPIWSLLVDLNKLIGCLSNSLRSTYFSKEFDALCGFHTQKNVNRYVWQQKGWWSREHTSYAKWEIVKTPLEW
jgi:ribosomal protein L37E